MASVTMVKDFRSFDPADARVILAEGTGQILGGLHAELSAYAKQALERRGVEVRTNTMAAAINDHSLQLGEEAIRARTIIWAAGVAASPLARTLGSELDRMGRILVNEDLTLSDHPEIQVIGDMAHFKTDQGTPLPGVSPVAIQQGRHAAANIRRVLRGRAPIPFKYIDKGMMATIGRNSAVVDLRILRLQGFIAWLAWVFLHIAYLVGFRNRVVTLFEWAYAYATSRKGSRLITWSLEPEAEKFQKQENRTEQKTKP